LQKTENLVILQDDRAPAPPVQTNSGKKRRLKPAATKPFSRSAMVLCENRKLPLTKPLPHQKSPLQGLYMHSASKFPSIKALLTGAVPFLLQFGKFLPGQTPGELGVAQIGFDLA
jgi:hypothetical protein